MSAFLRLSDFEWASAARYLQYVSVNAGLTEFSLDQCHNFRVSGRSSGRTTKENLSRLGRSKKRLKKVVLENNACLERWVSDRQEGNQRLEKEELAVIRAFYNQNKGVVSVLDRHIAQVEAIKELWACSCSALDSAEREVIGDDSLF